MQWHKHWDIRGKHATLSPSSYHWLNYTPDKLRTVLRAEAAKKRGTLMHGLAQNMISLGIRPAKNKQTFNLYVNDAISFGMTPEVELMYSKNCFGTADAIRFDEDNMFLRIHDLKTGKTKASMNQLKCYAALFCLEYGYAPYAIHMELRIYQSNEIQVYEPSPEEIEEIMALIVDFNKIVEEIDNEEDSAA